MALPPPGLGVVPFQGKDGSSRQQGQPFAGMCSSPCRSAGDQDHHLIYSDCVVGLIKSRRAIPDEVGPKGAGECFGVDAAMAQDLRGKVLAARRDLDEGDECVVREQFQVFLGHFAVQQQAEFAPVPLNPAERPQPHLEPLRGNPNSHLRGPGGQEKSAYGSDHHEQGAGGQRQPDGEQGEEGRRLREAQRGPVRAELDQEAGKHRRDQQTPQAGYERPAAVHFEVDDRQGNIHVTAFRGSSRGGGRRILPYSLMSDHFARRRYLINFDSRRMGQVFTDVLVVGAGVAGLRAALAASNDASVILTTKDAVPDCNTAWAQGGIAAVIDRADSVAAHVADTLAVGCGLCHPDIVQTLAEESPRCLAELREWGAKFDVEAGTVALGMEGGHSARRIVHAQGDATGREVSRSLAAQVQSCERIRVFQNCFVIDLVVEGDRCVAAITHHEKYGHQIIWAKAIILASGGAGCLFRETTNAPSATADGHALAFRAGASLRDMEFMQFHPTALYLAGAARALVSEAVRGEGAYLVDREGRRFMPAFHPDAELAPRDVVSRAILRHIAQSGATCAYLDVRHFPTGRFQTRFPNIAALCRNFDIQPERDLIPIRPAAHYMIGGVAVDADGRSSITGLFACGEAASTGLHGANRLASNSLAEGLVFGKRAGQAAAALARSEPGPAAPRALAQAVDPSPRTELDVADVRNSLRALSWRNLGIEREEERINETMEIIDFWGRYVMDKVFEQRAAWETQNLLTVSRCMAQAARARKESRGVHYRTDYPDTDDRQFLGHITLRRSIDGINVDFQGIG